MTNANMRYYLIETEYVGPNKRYSNGSWRGDTRVLTISTEPGETNSSHQPRESGWLGTTNDIHAAARGAFDTVEAARIEAHNLGFTKHRYLDGNEEYRYTSDAPSEFEDGEEWVSPEAARAQWDAGDWLINALGSDGVCEEYGVTVRTTDEELEQIADRIEDEARHTEVDGLTVELHGTIELLTELRDELRGGKE